MKNMKHIFGCLLCYVLCSLPVHGEVAELDQSALIDELARQGMNELLERLGEKSGGDRIIEGELEVARLKIRASDRGVDESERGDAIREAIDVLSALIRENPEHQQVPIWRTNLGEMVLVDLLQIAERNAAEFYEFGVPTDSQRIAYESSVVRALRALTEADRRFFELRDERGRQADNDPDRIGDMLWKRMKRDYMEAKTPYLLAHAAYYTALLPQDHAYYKNLGDPSFPEQRKQPDQERERLLSLAIERSKGFADDPSDAASIAAKCLMGRAIIRSSGGDVDRAGLIFDSLRKEGFYHLLAELSRSVSRLENGDRRGAGVALTELEQEPGIRANLFYRLLVVDQLHLQKLAEALEQEESRRSIAVSEAYSVYEDLINDPSLGDQAAGIKNYIYRRWESALAGSEGKGVAVDQLPIPVMTAVAEMSRMAGQNLMIDADQADQIGDTDLATQLRTQAAPKLERSIQLCKRVLGLQGISQESRSSLMFNLGMALYFQADGDVEGQLEAAKTWTELADQMPAQKQAEEGIEIGISVLRQLHSHTPRPDGVNEGYSNAAEVLFEKFPTSKAADGERVYYAYAVLSPAGEYQRASELLGQMPREHEQYFEARREQLFNLHELVRASGKTVDRRTAEQQLDDAASELIRVAGTVSYGPEAESSKNAAGWARLMKAELAIERGRTEDALKELDGFDREYAEDEELLRESLAKGIVALAQAGDYSQVLTRAKAMMERFSDDAAAVIDGVLEDLDSRIDQIRQAAAESRVERTKQEMLDQAMTLARTTEGLSQMLLEWAQDQGYSDEDLVAFKLLLAKGRRLAGKPDGAVLILDPLAKQYADHPGIIHQVAEAQFAKGGEPALIQAAAQFDRLIVGLEGQEDQDLKKIWWNAWMRRLQVSDILNQGTGDIPLRVRQLRLTDPNLGGEPSRTVLSKLEVKHSAR